MLKGIFNKRSAGSATAEVSRIEFDDPVLGRDGLDMAAILKGMHITMQNGTIKTAIERVSQALRPIALSNLMPDAPVSSNLLDQSEVLITQEMGRLPCTRLLKETGGDWEVASALAVVSLAGLVETQYRTAMGLPEVALQDEIIPPAPVAQLV